MSTAKVRLAHFSDIHITTPKCSWEARDWCSKRASAWVNLRLLGRGHRFAQADQVLQALRADLEQRQPDHAIFSGDATALGFTDEITQAARLLGLAANVPAWLPGLAVPGNHDYCTPWSAKSGAFEAHFAPWQQGVRMGSEVYPFAQKVGPLWLVAVNSATANFWPWDASGGVGTDQLQRLTQLLAQLDTGPRVLVTHYPVCKPNGELEGKAHGLRDLADLIRVAEQGNIALWLHGHLHKKYFHAQTQHANFPSICVGSATQTNRWSYAEYTIAGPTLSACWRSYEPAKNQFQAGEMFELRLHVK